MALTNAYCTVAQLRNQFGDNAAKLPEELLERAVNATSRAIDRYTGRRFWQDPAPVTRAVRVRDSDAYEIDVPDISTTTGLAIETGTDGTYTTTWTAGDYELHPDGYDLDHPEAYAWWRISSTGSLTFPTGHRRATVQITARFGWSAIPPDVEQACVIRAASLFKRNEAPFGVAGFGDFGPVRITRRDPDVIDLLHHFLLTTVGAV